MILKMKSVMGEGWKLYSNITVFSHNLSAKNGYIQMNFTNKYGQQWQKISYSDAYLLNGETGETIERIKSEYKGPWKCPGGPNYIE